MQFYAGTGPSGRKAPAVAGSWGRPAAS